MTGMMIAAPILLSLTLLISGLAKLGARRGTEDAMTSLRLPLRSFHRSVATVLPVVEIVLALVLWVPFVPLQVLTAVVIALLMITYLMIIARALSWDEVVECSCFGTLASPTVSRTTLGRNALLVALSLLTVVSAGSGLLDHALVLAPLSLISTGAGLVTAIVLAALAIGTTTPAAAGAPEEDAWGAGSAGARGAATGDAGPRGPAPGGPAPGDGAPAETSRVRGPGGSSDGMADGEAPGKADGATDGEVDEDELLDYERAPIPAAVLQQADTRLVTLRALAAQRAVLLVFVTEGCGPCERVLDHAEAWIEELSPFMDVRFVFSRRLEDLRERTVRRVGDRALHDLQFCARTALGGRTAPGAVLMGADGKLAGGPVDGGSAVIEFVEEIQEQLAIAQREGEIAAP
ncbi:TlpA family protein disulfide reductase [Brachybacterium sp. AOP43-C2-M15]|uniref:TlpA family protein disulfide reductase n=1 Tax=Brachybacterium sp. AOP43-C2-M15 TaxID=3457661 RepID=UPI004034A540